jgi:hypothetical protein
MIHQNELALLGYMLGTNRIARLSCADSSADVRDWIRGHKDPSPEQAARLQCVYRHLTRINEGEGPVIALEWFTSADIIKHVRENNFTEVDRLAEFHMYPNDDE